MKLRKLLESKRNEILEIAERYGARSVRIFGSCARGEDHGFSDVDFLVELEPGTSLMDHAGLVMDLENLLGTRVDVATVRGLKERIRDRVLKEAVSLRGTTESGCSTSWKRSSESNDTR